MHILNFGHAKQERGKHNALLYSTQHWNGSKDINHCKILPWIGQVNIFSCYSPVSYPALKRKWYDFTEKHHMDQTSSERTKKKSSFLVSHSELIEMAMTRKLRENMVTKPGAHFYIFVQRCSMDQLIWSKTKATTCGLFWYIFWEIFTLSSLKLLLASIHKKGTSTQSLPTGY